MRLCASLTLMSLRVSSSTLTQSSRSSGHVDVAPRPIHSDGATKCAARKSLVDREQNPHRAFRDRIRSGAPTLGAPTRSWHTLHQGGCPRPSTLVSIQGRLPSLLHFRRTRSGRPRLLGCSPRSGATGQIVALRKRRRVLVKVQPLPQPQGPAPGRAGPPRAPRGLRWSDPLGPRNAGRYVWNLGVFRRIPPRCAARNGRPPSPEDSGRS